MFANNSFKTFFSFLSLFDLFQQNVSLKLYNRFRVSIHLGKFLSIGIISFILYNFLSSDMIMKTNPIILYQSNILNFRPKILLSEKNFTFSFAIVDDDNKIYYDPTYINFQVMRKNVVNGTELTFFESEIEKCQKHYFERFDDYFDSFNVSNRFCLKEKEILLRGFWDEKELNYLEVLVNKCVNSSESKVVCKDEREIEKYLVGKFFSYWIEQKNIDLTNAENLLTSSIKNIYTGIDYKQSKTYRFFMKKSIIKEDKGVIYPTEETIETYMHGNIESDFLSSRAILISLVFYSSEAIQISQRRYQKLFDLFASLGGILNSLTIVCAIIVKYFHEWEITELILNNLNVFSENYRGFNIKKTYHLNGKISSKKPTFNLNEKLSLQQSVLNFNGFVKKKKFFCLENSDLQFDRFSKFKKIKKLTLSLWEKLVLACKRKKNRNHKEKLYLEYIRISNHKIDLIEILKKLEEIDKIKLLLFNQKQLLFFNSIDKRYIYLSKKEKNQGIFKYKINLDKISQQNKKLLEDYIQNVYENKGCEEIDRRLISLMDMTLANGN